MFADRVEIEAWAGDGGDGCSSFRKEKYVPRGGPDGGNGGNGGNIIILARQGVNSLVALTHRKQWRAEGGANGTGSNCHGKSGKDSLVLVPPGTLVMDLANGFVIKDLKSDGDQLIAAHGGHGGKGNTHFKSSTNQAPRTTTKGLVGERRRLLLELKVIADVGLIGKPNAGKSTLLSRLSHARPEIADYPFTTKYPNLGMVTVDREQAFVLADIPGLIEGAHAGVGLGHDFLKHIERSGVLVHLVEPLPADQTQPVENYLTIRNELNRYSSDLGKRIEIVAVSKGELPDAETVRAELQRHVASTVLLISAVTGAGLVELCRAIVGALERERKTRSESTALPVYS